MNAQIIVKIPKKRKKINPKKCTLRNSEYASCKRKMRYKTDGEASHAIATRRRNGDYTPLDIYYCSYCGGYHLTKSTDDNRFLLSQMKEINEVEDERTSVSDT